MEWREVNGVRWLQAELGPAGRGSGSGNVAFGTRLGGVSEPPFDRLNLGLLTDDEGTAVLENRRRLAAALGLDPGRIAFALQVHGAGLEIHAGGDASPHRSFLAADGQNGQPPGSVREADGQVMAAPGLAGLVFTADCLPVALSGPGGVAMLHCGWRGLAAGILAAGAAAVGATEAAIGPGIGPCCYEVGDEVLAAFADLGEGVAVPPPADGSSPGPHLDLAEVARRLLAAAGVERVQSAGLCTSCEPELFFSHRRDRGRTGRQGSLAWIEAG